MTEAELQEDRVLRNAAKRLVTQSLQRVRGDMTSRSLGSRVLERARDGAAQIADDTSEFAGNHRAQLGTGLLVGLVAFVGWLFRDQLADAIYNVVHRDEGPVHEIADDLSEKAEQLADDARSIID